LINYGRKKKVKAPNEVRENVHFITLFKSEEIYSLRNMKGYQLTNKENNTILSIKNEIKSVEKEINYLRRKVDRFRIWKEVFSNMKEIVDELDLENTQYAVQLKENNYLLWKFKKKWRLITEVNFKYNTIRTEFKLTGRKKKRRKLNILANLFEAGRKLINNIDMNILINKQNLCSILKLHKKMHNNNRYFESVNSRKFQFYSQLIERYRSSIITSKPNYLFLTSSNIKINEHLRRSETFKINNNIITFNEVFNQMIAMKKRSDLDYKYAIFGKSVNL
jgi:hypothetical protein